MFVNSSNTHLNIVKSYMCVPQKKSCLIDFESSLLLLGLFVFGFPAAGEQVWFLFPLMFCIFSFALQSWYSSLTTTPELLLKPLLPNCFPCSPPCICIKLAGPLTDQLKTFLRTGCVLQAHQQHLDSPD